MPDLIDSHTTAHPTTKASRSNSEWETSGTDVNTEDERQSRSITSIRRSVSHGRSESEDSTRGSIAGSRRSASQRSSEGDDSAGNRRKSLKKDELLLLDNLISSVCSNCKNHRYCEYPAVVMLISDGYIDDACDGLGEAVHCRVVDRERQGGDMSPGYHAFLIDAHIFTKIFCRKVSFWLSVLMESI